MDGTAIIDESHNCDNRDGTWRNPSVWKGLEVARDSEPTRFDLFEDKMFFDCLREVKRRPKIIREV
jgi:hypothetical protein